MPFVVAEFDPGEISFFHHDRAFRRYDPPQTHTTSVHPGLDKRDQSDDIAEMRHQVSPILDAVKSTVPQEVGA